MQKGSAFLHAEMITPMGAGARAFAFFVPSPQAQSEKWEPDFRNELRVNKKTGKDRMGSIGERGRNPEERFFLQPLLAIGQPFRTLV
jgi:hypothetical protein